MSDESEEIERKRIAEHESEENIYTIALQNRTGIVWAPTGSVASSLRI
jgi:hypothetical protein